MATIDKIKLSGTTYDIVDSSAVHSMDGYWTSGQTESAITAATGALAETIAEQHYQTSGDVQNAISAATDPINSVLTAHTANTDIHVTTSDKETWNAKADISDIPSVSGYADSVKYNNTSKYVEFYHGGTGGTKVFEYDASPFLIDGMVQNVEIKNVPITEAASTADTAYTFTSGATTEFIIKVKDSWWLNESNAVGLVDSLDRYGAVIFPHNGSIQVDGDASGTSVGNTIYATATGSAIYDGIEIVPDWSVYDSVEAVYGSQTCLVISFNTDAGKQDINIPLTEIFDPSNYYTKSQIDNIVTGITQDIEEATSGKADTTAVTQVNNTLTAHTADTTIHVTSSDKSTWSAKQDALVSGTNIKTVGGNSLLGSGDIAFPAGMTAEVSGTTLIFS